MSYRALTGEQVEEFLHRGHVKVSGCFSDEDARPWLERAWVRLGYDPTDRSTWAESYVRMPALSRVEVSKFAPKAWAAICDLLGGEERVDGGRGWTDGFVVNLDRGDGDRAWKPTPLDSPRWHIDGDYYRHFLDSQELGLVAIVLWSDVESQGGGTLIACDSVGQVARLLSAHPEGLLQSEIRYEDVLARCSEFEEVTGQVGDVVLLHPFTIHAVSQNRRGTARFITNPAFGLKERMRFSRQGYSEYSPVEAAILAAHGVTCLDYRATGVRERVVPNRVRSNRERRSVEKRRLIEAGLDVE